MMEDPICVDKWHLWHGRTGLQQIAQLLWIGPDYNDLFELEFELNSSAIGGGGYQLPPSTYRVRLRGERAILYDARRRRQQRDEMAIALHANNQQRWLVARPLKPSISAGC